jgi:hypothetical protein
MQSVVSVATLHNTAFQDEALYLYAGRIQVHHWLGGPPSLDHFAYYFSGYPAVYPVIGGALDLIGGLQLARDFSLLCMLGVTTIVYVGTRRLFPRSAAIFASAAYACAGVVLYVGRLATFDALCLFLLALATLIALYAATSHRPGLSLMLGPILVLAILAKYAALLFVFPIFGLLAFLGVASRGWARTLLRLTDGAVGFAVSLYVAYRLIDHAAFHAVSGSTTHRVTGSKDPRLGLVTHVLQMGGVLYTLALCGLVLVVLQRPRLRIVAPLLFASSLLMPAYHVRQGEFISLDKHIAYGLFFAAPLAGYALAWLSGQVHDTLATAYRGRWLAGVAVVLVLFTLGLGQSQQLYSAWANTSALNYDLHTQLRNGAGRVLAEDIELIRFEGADITQQWQWNDIRHFYYVDSAHRQLVGDRGLVQAIKERDFSLVELSFVYLPNAAYFVAQQLAYSRNYDLIAVVPFRNSYGTGHFYLWRSAKLPGHGNFKSLAQLKL